MRRGLPWWVHVTHLVLTVCSGGLWLPVWWLHWVASGGPRDRHHWRLWS